MNYKHYIHLVQFSIHSLDKSFHYAIQEEVHRFAITFHRNRSGKKGVQSILLEIKGVGEGRAKTLLRHFKSLSAIQKATKDELCAVVPKAVAENIYKFFN